MQWSEQRNEIAAALAKAQIDMGRVVKSAENPHFKSKYAQLDDFLTAAMDALNRNGIAFLQSPQFDGTNVTIIGIMVHSSGQWVSDSLVMRPEKTTPQGIGSCITYARRYQAQSFFGLASEDDDGNEASNVESKNKSKSKDEPRPPRQEAPKDKQRPQQAEAPRLFDLNSNEHIDWLERSCKKLGVADPDVISAIALKLNGRPVTDAPLVVREFTQNAKEEKKTEGSEQAPQLPGSAAE